jgi:hypothetical protein
MTSERDLGLRLRAHLLGRPVLRLGRVPAPPVDAAGRMLVAFLRMGGESSPWAIGWKVGDEAVEFRSVPEARRRSDVAAMVAEFGKALEAHFAAGGHRQVWVPGGTHLEMFHFLALRYVPARKADPGLLATLQRTGRRSADLFESANNPNRATCLNATARLKELFTFPCEPIRENHLGYLLGWLGAGDASTRRRRAEEAERFPASTSLDPEFERTLSREVEAWNAATSDGDRARWAKSIADGLRTEVERRLELLLAAIDAYEQAAEPNEGASRIAAASAEAIDSFATNEERLAEGGFGRSAETDHSPVAAAAGFAHRDADEVAARAALVPWDPAAQDDLIAAGSAFLGDVARLEIVALTSRKSRQELAVLASSRTPLRLRVGDEVFVAGNAAGRGAWEIIDIDDDPASEVRRIRLRSDAFPPKGPPVKAGAKGIVFHEKFDPELRRRLGRMTLALARQARDGDAPGGWILARLAARETPEIPPDTEQFDGTNARIDPDA